MSLFCSNQFNIDLIQFNNCVDVVKELSLYMQQWLGTKAPLEKEKKKKLWEKPGSVEP